MDKLRWTEDEVVGFLEDSIKSNTATESELDFYLTYSWTGELNKNLYIYRKIVRKMRREYKGE